MTPKRCEIEGCDWTICVQRHRITPGREGGKYILGNVIALCPNHHWQADRDQFTRDELRSIVNERIRLVEYELQQAGTGEAAEAGSDASEESVPGCADSGPATEDGDDAGPASE